MGWVFFLLGLLGVDHLWHDMTYICKDVRRSSSFFSGGSFYGRSFDGVHIFFEFLNIRFFLSKLFFGM